MRGCKRFLERVWALMDIVTDGDGFSPELDAEFHRTIKKVGDDIETLKFNTAIASLMALINKIYDKKSVTRGELATYVQLLNPFAPHITEEMWQLLGHKNQLAYQPWPKYDPARCVDDVVEIAVQINGKVRDRITVAADADEAAALAAAHASEKVAHEINGKNIIKEIYVRGKIVNIVAK